MYCVCIFYTCVRRVVHGLVPLITTVGSQIEQIGKVEKEVATRVEKARTVYQIWRRKVFRSHSLTRHTKMRVFRTLVMSILLYGAET